MVIGKIADLEVLCLCYVIVSIQSGELELELLEQVTEEGTV